MVYELFLSVLISVIGGPGLVGLLFAVIKRDLERKLQAAEDKQRKRSQMMIERDKMLSELRQAQGRVLFWLKKGILDNYVNGELEPIIISQERSAYSRRY